MLLRGDGGESGAQSFTRRLGRVPVDRAIHTGVAMPIRALRCPTNTLWNKDATNIAVTTRNASLLGCWQTATGQNWVRPGPASDNVITWYYYHLIGHYLLIRDLKPGSRKVIFARNNGFGPQNIRLTMASARKFPARGTWPHCPLIYVERQPECRPTASEFYSVESWGQGTTDGKNGGNNDNNMIVFGHFAVSVSLLQCLVALQNQ